MAGPECGTVAVGGVSQSDHLKANHHSLKGRRGSDELYCRGRGQCTLLSNGVLQQTSPSVISQSAVASLDKGVEGRPRRPAVWAPTPLCALCSRHPPSVLPPAGLGELGVH